MLNKLKIYIVEDMAVSRLALTKILLKHGHTVIGSSAKAQSAFDNIINSPVDLVLIDINLLGNRDGIWLAKQIRAEMFIPFIYLTAYGDDETIAQLGKTEPDGYLMKPYDKSTLLATIQIAYQKFHGAKRNHTENKTTEEKKFLIVYKGVAKMRILYKDILFLESEGNYVNFHTSQDIYSKRTSLKSLQDVLSPEVFIRINNGLIVNLNHVIAIRTRQVIMANNKSLPVSRSRHSALKDAFNGSL